MRKVVAIILSLSFFMFLSFDKAKGVEVIEFSKVKSNYTLTELVNKQIGKSKTPIVYFYADWCAPCKRFSKSLKSKLLKETFKNTVLIKINVDDNEDLAISHSVRAIPTFIKMGKDAEAMASITSDKWKEDIPKNIAPVMHKLIHTDEYNKK